MNVQQCMNRHPAVLPLEARLGHALDLLRSRGLRHVPVCDGDRFLGIVSLHDIEVTHTNDGSASLDRGVVGIIELGTTTLTGDESIEDAWRVLSRTPVLNPLPVVRDGRLLGTVSHHELMRAMAGLPTDAVGPRTSAVHPATGSRSWLSMLVPPMDDKTDGHPEQRTRRPSAERNSA